MLEMLSRFLGRGPTNTDIEEPDDSPEVSDGFGSFLLSEYSNIAQAHFKTTETISQFLKHYLTIISAPIAILGIVVSLGSSQVFASSTLVTVATGVSVLFLVIFVVGVWVLSYVVNLRMDAILYARTINGIRKYFYDQECRLDLAEKGKLRVLPQSPVLPRYFEAWFFGPVVLIFACLDAVYVWLGSAGLAYYQFGIAKPLAHVGVMIPVGLSVILHIGVYYLYARHREDAYLRSNILGVDIDGVTNQHREQFCRFLHTHTGKAVQPAGITKIPVHACPGLGVTREDERLVFNDPAYWIDMPALQGAADILTRLRTSMGLRVHMFTHRPWPLTAGLSGACEKETKRKWRSAARAYARRVHRSRAWWRGPQSWLVSIGDVFPYGIRRPRGLLRKAGWVDRITKLWLEENSFRYHKIVIEKGSEEVADTSSHVINRFYACRLKSIRYFVEDDLVKAKKLAFICDLVFLMDHPYNQMDQLPVNVIRVQSWEEILRHITEVW